MVKVRDVSIIPDLEDIVSERNYAVKFFAPAGGDLVIFDFYSSNALVGFLMSDWLSLADIISEVKPLQHDFAPSERLVFLDFFGVPISLLHKQFVEFMISRFGTLISVDLNFEQPDRIDVISCLAAIPLDTLQSELFVNLNGIKTKISM